MKPYTSLTNEEKLALTEEQFTDAVKAEALNRAIEIPIPIGDLAEKVGFNGYHRPMDSMRLYEIIAPKSYGEERTGIAFRTEQQALDAVEGAICVREETNYQKHTTTQKVIDGDFRVACVHVSLTSRQSFYAAIEEFDQCVEKFDELVEECTKDLQEIRQNQYDKEVRDRRWAEFMRLSDNNAEIAGAFWRKAGHGEPPVK